MTKPNYEEADLILKLYDLRREALLRKARAWFMSHYEAHSWEDRMRKYPPESEEDRFARMVVSYWDMAVAFVNNGAIEEELFFSLSGEPYRVWTKIQPWLAQARVERRNPAMYCNLERFAANYEKWRDKHLQKMEHAAKSEKKETANNNSAKKKK